MSRHVCLIELRDVNLVVDRERVIRVLQTEHGFLEVERHPLREGVGWVEQAKVLRRRWLFGKGAKGRRESQSRLLPYFFFCMVFSHGHTAVNRLGSALRSAACHMPRGRLAE